MNPDLQAQLKQRYPKLFRAPGWRLIDPNVSVVEGYQLESNEAPFDHNGIECDDGWFSVVDRLCKAAEAEIDTLVASGVARERWPRVAQIKEKVGTLRFYVSGQVTEALRSDIAQAEIETRSTCEHCGKPGSLRDGRWRKTQCSECFAQTAAMKRQ